MKKFREIPVEKLALQLAGRSDLDVPHVLRQVEGWQRLRTKVPTWAAIDELEYPSRLALEQCSGEAAARVKAQLVARVVRALGGGKYAMADLTGGLGVDFSFISPHFDRAVYVERQAELCRVARHNFPLLHLNHAQVVCADAIDYLHQMEPVDFIFLDPARRDGAGRKTVLIEDCEPDVCALSNLLMQKARVVMLKLSTMLDIAGALRALKGVVQVCVVSVEGECKDLLILMALSSVQKALLEVGDAELASSTGGPLIVAREGENTFAFTQADEAAANVQYADAPEAYLYEPGPALLKVGAFKLVAQRYGLQKIHPNSHLYTAPQAVSGFVGRSFKVEQVYGFSKADLRRLRDAVSQANLTVRNFPASVDALRKKLKLREGGEIYLFATTLRNGLHVLIQCRKCREIGL